MTCTTIYLQLAPYPVPSSIGALDYAAPRRNWFKQSSKFRALGWPFARHRTGSSAR